jgi:hypothetical protein
MLTSGLKATIEIIILSIYPDQYYGIKRAERTCALLVHFTGINQLFTNQLITPPSKITISGAGKIFLSFEILLSN